MFDGADRDREGSRIIVSAIDQDRLRHSKASACPRLDLERGTDKAGKAKPGKSGERQGKDKAKDKPEDDEN